MESGKLQQSPTVSILRLQDPGHSTLRQTCVCTPYLIAPLYLHFQLTLSTEQAITIVGLTTGGDPVNGTFDFSITSTPPCTLPIADSCSSAAFNPSANQWAAYSTDKWLATYVSDNGIETFGGLYDAISAEFVTNETQGSCKKIISVSFFSCSFFQVELTVCQWYANLVPPNITAYRLIRLRRTVLQCKVIWYSGESYVLAT